VAVLGVAVGVTVGGHSNLALASGGTPAAELDVRLPSMPVEVVLRADRAFYRTALVSRADPALTQLVSSGGFGGEAGARAELRPLSWLGLHAALGMVGRQVEATLTLQGGPGGGATETSSALSLGVAAGAGFSVRAGPGRLLVEGGYAWLPAKGALRGNLGGWGARAGFLWELL